MRRSHIHRHWDRRTSSVPKGYLRGKVLRLLNKKPMSGAEIMSDIEENTGHRWRPSPGSVYPLLSWLLDSGYTKELADTEAGVRRYELTEEGRKLLEEHEERRAQDKGARFFGPQFDEWDGALPEGVRELAESWHKMRRASYALRRKLMKEYSETLVLEAKKLVDEFTEKISRIAEFDKA
ncbi:MAG: PadR family transcriptional regulator [Candidatus Thorarchaeota archaeon SMTZ1-45]|nr:MAG: hypothetical protein AM325_16310 [Candidatus Thorarchaeota archaeon SMTZ1-45]